MKKSLVMMVAAMMLLVGCGTTQQVSVTNNPDAAANSLGKNAGMAIDQLYSNYKSSGTIDFTNIMNISSSLSLVGAAQQLVKNKSDKDYRQQFILGMVSNSVNITDINSQTITNELESLAEKTNVDKLQDAMQKGQVTATEVQNVKNSVTTIINTFKK